MSWRDVPCLLVLGLSFGCSRAPIVGTKAPVRELPLHLECRGQGQPPVVLDAGLGNDSSVWAAVVPDIARTTRVCAYDRAGMGKSRRPAPRPHSNQMMAEELYELLRAAEVPGPYVLVGHSLGGANVRYFAAKHPRAVVGMVLVDSVTAQQPARYWSLMPEALLSEFKNGLAGLPEGLDYDTFRVGLEQLDTVSPSLGKVPLVVLTRGKAPPSPPEVSAVRAAEMEQAWASMQADLARLSSNSAQIVVEGAGHHIQLDRPGVVVAAVREVVASSREARPVRAAAVNAQPE